MQRKRRIRLFALAASVGVSLAALAFFLPERDRMFQGKRESEWLTNIVDGSQLSDDENKAQAKRWRDFGPDGLRVLERGLEPSRGHRYRKFYRHYAPKLHRSMAGLLPQPTTDKRFGTRVSVISLLCSMETNAWPAWRAAARALDDENDTVRQSALNFFTWREGNSVCLNQMPARDKKKLLPLFVRALESRGNWGLPSNAALALRYYPEEKLVVVPVLARALAHPQPHVRLTVAESLNRIDAAAAGRVGVVNALEALVLQPDDRIAWRAASELRNCRNDAEEAVAALITALRSTNADVSCVAVWSLETFPSHANTIIPELRKAMERKDDAAGCAKNGIQSLESRQRR
jgi:hypothetical protein